MRLLALMVVVTATPVLAQAGIDIRKTPTVPVSELPQQGQIDISKLPIETRLSLLEKAGATTRQQMASLKAQNTALRAEIDNQKAQIAALQSDAATAAKATANRFALQDEKLGTISQAVGTVPGHTHAVIVIGPSLGCAPDAQCSMLPNGGALEGSTGLPIPKP